MIVTDMDGTLLNGDSEISERTYQILMALQKQGIKVVLASGRNYNSLSKFAAQLNLQDYDGWIVGMNGQQIASLQTNEYEVLKRLSPDLIKRAFKFAVKKDIEYIAVLDKELYAYLSPRIIEKKKAYIKAHNLSDKVLTGGVFGPIHPQSHYDKTNYINDIENIPNQEFNKIVFTEEPEIMEIISDEMKEYFKGEIDFAFTSPRWIEGMPAGISKGSAIKVIAEKEGINLDEVIAFGDGENDISMLEVAGTAIAMENAMDSVKAHADIIALNNLDDGVAIILEKLLK